MTAQTPSPITVFGRPTCEDTAIVRSRLDVLGTPYRNVNIEADEGAARLVETVNDGNRSTPTLLFGGTESAVTEPTLDDLDERLLAEGWPIERPAPTQYQGDLVATPLPLLNLTEPSGAAFGLAQFRGKREIAVFFAHAADCMACSGLARQLAAAHVSAKLGDAGARAIVVVPGGPEVAQRWREESTDRLTILADRDGRWREAVLARVAPASVGTSPAILLALDRYLTPRIGSIATESGGLITPFQAAEWLEFVALECAECATPIGWGDAES
jgi:mycoredoxin